MKNDPSGEMTLSLGHIAMGVDKTMLLSGQVFQATAHHQSFNALVSVKKDGRKLKETSKEKQELLKVEHKKWFGHKLQTHITETAKTRQKSEELFKSITTNRSKYQQPFQSGPLD